MVMCKRKVLVYLQGVLSLVCLYGRFGQTNCNVMTFFGLTYLGYQNPIGDRMIRNPRGPSNPNGKESFAFAYVNNRSESGAWLSFGLELPKGLATWKIGS